MYNFDILYELYCKIKENVATEEEKEEYRLELEVSSASEEYLIDLFEEQYEQDLIELNK